MAFTTDELGAMLSVFNYYQDWDDLSELIEYDVQTLRTKIMSEMSAAILYDLECE
jgi:hypothetical protein